MARKNALGRGLSALIEDADKEKLEKLGTINDIDIRTIETNPFQPRSKFSEEGLQELASSIRELGIIQPITVRAIENDRYQLITGERRYRAALLAGIETIPAYIRLADDQAMLELALVENIQREDLDAIEVAISYQRLIEECRLTQENLSERVGRKRSTISNYLRLLKLPAEIQLGIREKKISMGHARTLVNIEDPEIQIEAYYKTIKDDLSVRRVEELVRDINRKGMKDTRNVERRKQIIRDFEDLQTLLSEFFSTDVKFRMNDQGRGKIVIPFEDNKDLERIMGIFDRFKT